MSTSRGPFENAFKYWGNTVPKPKSTTPPPITEAPDPLAKYKLKAPTDKGTSLAPLDKDKVQFAKNKRILDGLLNK